MFSIDLARNRFKSEWVKDLKKEDVFYPRESRRPWKLLDMDISSNEYLYGIFLNEEEHNSFFSVKLDWSFDPFGHSVKHATDTILSIYNDNNFTALKISNQTSNQILALADTHRIYFNYADNMIKKNKEFFATLPKVPFFCYISNLPAPVDMLKFNHNDNFLSVVLRDKSIFLYKLYFNEKGKKFAIRQSSFDNLKTVSCDFVLLTNKEFLVFGMKFINFWDINENKWNFNLKQRLLRGWNREEYITSIAFDNISNNSNIISTLLISSSQGTVTRIDTYPYHPYINIGGSTNYYENKKTYIYGACSCIEPYKIKGTQYGRKTMFSVSVTKEGYIRVWDDDFDTNGKGKVVRFDSGVKNIKKILFHPVKNILFLLTGDKGYKAVDIDYRRALQQYPRLSDINEVATNDKYIDHVSFQKLTFTKSVYTIYLFCDCVLNDIQGQRDMALTFNNDGFVYIKIKDTIQAFANMMEATDEEYFEDMDDLNYEDVNICLPELGRRLLKGVKNLQLYPFHLEKTINMILSGKIKFVTVNNISSSSSSSRSSELGKRKKMELLNKLNLRF